MVWNELHGLNSFDRVLEHVAFSGLTSVSIIY